MKRLFRSKPSDKGDQTMQNRHSQNLSPSGVLYLLMSLSFFLFLSPPSMHAHALMSLPQFVPAQLANHRKNKTRRQDSQVRGRKKEKEISWKKGPFLRGTQLVGSLCRREVFLFLYSSSISRFKLPITRLKSSHPASRSLENLPFLYKDPAFSLLLFLIRYPALVPRKRIDVCWNLLLRLDELPFFLSPDFHAVKTTVLLSICLSFLQHTLFLDLSSFFFISSLSSLSPSFSLLSPLRRWTKFFSSLCRLWPELPFHRPCNNSL